MLDESLNQFKFVAALDASNKLQLSNEMLDELVGSNVGTV